MPNFRTEVSELSVEVQNSETSFNKHAYSRIGLINVKYMISRARLSSLNLSLRITLILVQALEVMLVICSCQVPSFEKVRPKCL